MQVWNEEAQLREVGAAGPGGTGPLPEVTEGEGRGEAPPKQLVPEGRAICLIPMGLFYLADDSLQSF